MQIYFLLIILIFISTIFVAKKTKLYDYPSERKIHKYPVINVGGITIILSYICSVYLFEYDKIVNQIFLFSLYFLIIGFIDDRININPYYRLILQALISGYFVNSNDIHITHIALYSGQVLQLGSFSELFSVCCIIVIINSFNYFDGIDLNLITIVMSIIFFLGIVLDFLSINELIIIFMPLIFFGLFNYGLPRFPKMYLGDCGSTSLGFLIAALLLLYNKQEGQSLVVQQQIIWISSLTVYEFLSTTISRLVRKKNIFEPGKDHLHYGLNKIIKNKINVVCTISFLILILSLFGYYLTIYYLNFSFIIFIIMFFIYFFLREKLINF